MLLTAVLSLAPPALAADVADLAAELAAVRQAVLEQSIPEPRSSGVYLSYRGDIAPTSATLDILDADDAVQHSLTFDAGSGEALPRLAYQPLGDWRTQKARPCRLHVETGDNTRQTLDCRLPPLNAVAEVELLVTAGWFGLSARVLDWQAALATHEWDARTWRETGLLERFMAPLSPATLAAEDRPAEAQVREQGGAAAASVRLALGGCQQRPTDGLSSLYGLARQATHELGAAFWHEYASCALRASQPLQAERAADWLQRRVPGSDGEMEVRWRLARYQAGTGDVSGALARLRAAEGSVPGKLDSHWRELESRLLLASGEYEAARRLLSNGRHLRVAGDWLETYDARGLHYAMRANYAFALLKTDRGDEALAVLNRVGSSPAPDEATRALRDRANAKLGWHFLAREYGATAARIFERMSVTGPYANVALLGMGWAMLTPPGEAEPMVAPPGFDASDSDPPGVALRSLQKIGAIGCDQMLDAGPDAVRECVPETRFERMPYAGEHEERVRRALVYWNRLLETPRQDPAAVEAHIAAARAFVELGDGARSERLYQQAEQLAEQAGRDLGAFEALVSRPAAGFDPASGEPLSALAPPGQSPAAYDLAGWMADSEIRLLLDMPTTILRTRQWLRSTTTGTEQRDLQARLTAVERRAAKLLKERAGEALAGLREDYRRYRFQARYELTELRARGDNDQAMARAPAAP